MRLPIQIGRPQIIAGIALLFVFVECLYFSDGNYVDELMEEGGRFTRIWVIFCLRAFGPRYLVEFAAIPFAIAAVLLGGGIWWVSRRLFGDAGGYVALCSFALSPYAFFQDAHRNEAILAALGTYGFIYTAMGVAHTIYGSPRKWPARFVLLCFGLLIIILSNALLAVIAMLLGLVFLLYLTPGRRLLAVPLYLLSCASAFLIGFSVPEAVAKVSVSFEGLHPPAEWVWILTGVVVVTAPLFVAALLGYWTITKARWFGNTSALVAGALFIATLAQNSSPAVAIPFLCTFSGGVFADAIEVQQLRSWVISATAVLLAVEALLTIWLAIP